MNDYTGYAGKPIHIAKLSNGIAFCGDKRIDKFHTVLYSDNDKCTCKNCLRIVSKIEKAHTLFELQLKAIGEQPQ